MKQLINLLENGVYINTNDICNAINHKGIDVEGLLKMPYDGYDYLLQNIGDNRYSLYRKLKR